MAQPIDLPVDEAGAFCAGHSDASVSKFSRHRSEFVRGIRAFGGCTLQQAVRPTIGLLTVNAASLAPLAISYGIGLTCVTRGQQLMEPRRIHGTKGCR